MYLGNLLAFFEEIQALGGAGASKDLSVAKVSGDLVDRGQAGATGHRHYFGTLGWIHRDTMRSSNIALCAFGQVEHCVSEVAYIK